MDDAYTLVPVVAVKVGAPGVKRVVSAAETVNPEPRIFTR